MKIALPSTTDKSALLALAGVGAMTSTTFLYWLCKPRSPILDDDIKVGKEKLKLFRRVGFLFSRPLLLTPLFPSISLLRAVKRPFLTFLAMLASVTP